jgi:predicted DNA-binding transcriptional regulator AlpA
MTQAHCQVCGHNRPHRVRTIEVRNIITVAEILRDAAKLLHGNARHPIPRSTLQRWRDRNEFPKPIKTVGRHTELWDASEVRAWLEQWHARHRGETGR